MSIVSLDFFVINLVQSVTTIHWKMGYYAIIQHFHRGYLSQYSLVKKVKWYYIYYSKVKKRKMKLFLYNDGEETE